MTDAIALIDDLFFQMKVRETAKLAGISLETSTTGAALLQAAAANPEALVIVDLNARQGAIEAIESLSGANAVGNPRRIVAFLSRMYKQYPRGTRSRSGLSRGNAPLGVHAKPRPDFARSKFVNRVIESFRSGPTELRKFLLSIVLALAMFLAPEAASAQQQTAQNPESALASALSAACRQDSVAFANFLTSESALAYRLLPGPQRTGMMKRFVLLDDPGRPLLSTSSSWAHHHPLRCSRGFPERCAWAKCAFATTWPSSPWRFRLPTKPGAQSLLAWCVRTANGRLLSVGLLLLDIPSMAKQWEEADLEAQEDDAIANLRALATALNTYRRAFGKLPDSLVPLGPAPKGEISPETAGLVDAELAAGARNGYTFRYSIVSASGIPSVEDADKAAGYNLAATPDEYGKTGKRSFFLDATGVLRGDDKQGKVATSLDPVVDATGSTPH